MWWHSNLSGSIKYWESIGNSICYVFFEWTRGDVLNIKSHAWTRRGSKQIDNYTKYQRRIRGCRRLPSSWRSFKCRCSDKIWMIKIDRQIDSMIAYNAKYTILSTKSVKKRTLARNLSRIRYLEFWTNFAFLFSLFFCLVQFCGIFSPLKENYLWRCQRMEEVDLNCVW